MQIDYTYYFSDSYFTRDDFEDNINNFPFLHFSSQGYLTKAKFRYQGEHHKIKGLIHNIENFDRILKEIKNFKWQHRLYEDENYISMRFVVPESNNWVFTRDELTDLIAQNKEFLYLEFDAQDALTRIMVRGNIKYEDEMRKFVITMLGIYKHYEEIINFKI